VSQQESLPRHPQNGWLGGRRVHKSRCRDVFLSSDWLPPHSSVNRCHPLLRTTQFKPVEHLLTATYANRLRPKRFAFLSLCVCESAHQVRRYHYSTLYIYHGIPTKAFFSSSSSYRGRSDGFERYRRSGMVDKSKGLWIAKNTSSFEPAITPCRFSTIASYYSKNVKEPWKLQSKKQVYSNAEFETVKFRVGELRYPPFVSDRAWASFSGNSLAFGREKWRRRSQ
jgi:hypothetical protein